MKNSAGPVPVITTLLVHPDADIVDLLQQILDETIVLVIINLHVLVSVFGYLPRQDRQRTPYSKRISKLQTEQSLFTPRTYR